MAQASSTEDASELNFGEDFDKAECLSCAEVALLLKEKRDLLTSDQGINDVFEKTQKYVNIFGGNKSAETVKEIQKTLGKRRQLHPFEVASLANLAPSDVDEAKTLIPSLKLRYGDDEIQKMLNDLENLNEV